MISQIAFFQIIGLPLLAWGGITGLLLIIFVGLIGHLNMKGINFLNVKWHRLLAILAIIIALTHGIIGLLAIKGF